MKILLVCAAGMSTSMLVNNMKKCASSDIEIAAKPIGELSKVISDWDVVLVGPQVRYKYKDVEKICAQNGKKSGLIDIASYGRMDGAAALKQALSL